jgi:hypothetical protein
MLAQLVMLQSDRSLARAASFSETHLLVPRCRTDSVDQSALRWIYKCNTPPSDFVLLRASTQVHTFNGHPMMRTVVVYCHVNL